MCIPKSSCLTNIYRKVVKTETKARWYGCLYIYIYVCVCKVVDDDRYTAVLVRCAKCLINNRDVRGFVISSLPA